MLRRIFYWLIDRMEEQLGESMDYLRHMTDVSLPAVFKSSLFLPMAQHRKVVPPSAFYLAQMISARAEDCGPCVQMTVNQALQEDVPAEYLKAGLTDQPEALPPLLQKVYHFATAVATQQEIEPELRQRLREKIGEEGIVELSIGMAAEQVFPILKRGLGYARSCRLVDIDLQESVVAPASAPPETRPDLAAVNGREV